MAYFPFPTRSGFYLLMAGAFACSRTFRPFGMEQPSTDGASGSRAQKSTEGEAAAEAIFAPQSLPHAAWESSLTAIGLALEEAANTNKLKPEMELHHAAWLRDVDLLQEQCKKNGRYVDYVVGVEKITPLHLAVYRGVDRCVQLLLDQKFAWSFGMKTSGIHPIHIAASQGNASVLMRLLRAGASVEAIDATGRTALHWAAAKGSLLCVRKLIEAGSLLERSDDANDTPLCLALRYGHASAVRQLIQAGGVVDCLYCMGGSSDYIARWALVHGHDACLEALTKRATVFLDCQKKDACGTTLWELALRKKRHIGFQYLLKSPADLDYRNAQGHTLFQLAQQAGFIGNGALSADRVASPRILNSDGESPPQFAATSVQTEPMRVLSPIEGIDAHAQGADASTRLHRASMYKNIGVIRALFAAGAQARAKNQYGDAPLHTAVLLKDVAAVRTLLAAGAEVNVQNRYGDTPLHLAAEEKCLKVMDVLLAVSGIDVDAANEEGDTPLHFAALNGNTQAIRALLAAGAELNVPDKYGDTPLHFAAYLSGHVEALRALLQTAGLELNVQDKYGNTPLHATAEQGHPQALHALLQAPGIELNSRNKDGSSPLHLAAEEGYAEVIDALFAAGAELNVEDAYGDTPLHRAAKYGYAEAIRALLAAGAELQVQNKYGQTPLHLAATSGHAEAVRALLQTRGIGLNALDKYGQTPLHKAAAYGRIEALRTLLAAGAKLNVKDQENQTPLDVAQQRGHVRASDLLRQVGTR